VVAETEKPSSGIIESKWFTTVVFPLPDGAEKMMTLFKCSDKFNHLMPNWWYVSIGLF
jgi:hypothetical protein